MRQLWWLVVVVAVHLYEVSIYALGSMRLVLRTVLVQTERVRCGAVGREGRNIAIVKMEKMKR
jgi:hypothetical protein